MNTPSDRVQVIADRAYLRHPGACALCGSGTCIDGYVDTDVYFEYEGNIYFCMNCAKQIATVIGCLLPEESDHLKELSEKIATENKELKEKLNDFAGLDAAIRRVYGAGTFVTDGSVTGDAVEDEPAEPNGNPGASAQPDKRKSEPKEPTAKQGPLRPKRAQLSNTELNI